MFICGNDGESHEIITVTKPDLHERKTGSMVVKRVQIESGLAGRIVFLVRFELKRARQPNSEHLKVPVIDGSM